MSPVMLASLCLFYVVAKLLPSFLVLPNGPRALLDPVTSLNDLDNQSAEYARRGPKRAHPLHPHPQVRYARIRAMDESEIGSAVPILELLRFETLRHLRWRAAEKLGAILSIGDAALSGSTPEFLREGMALPEAPYILEVMASRRSMIIDPKWFPQLSPQLAVIAALHGAKLAHSIELAPSLALLWKRDKDANSPLLEAFESGFYDSNWKILYQSVRPLAVETALETLSPLTTDGLGACDHLNCLADVQRLYLFFRQWQYLLDTDFIP